MVARRSAKTATKTPTELSQDAKFQRDVEAGITGTTLHMIYPDNTQAEVNTAEKYYKKDKHTAAKPKTAQENRPLNTVTPNAEVNNDPWSDENTIPVTDNVTNAINSLIPAETHHEQLVAVAEETEETEDEDLSAGVEPDQTEDLDEEDAGTGIVLHGTQSAIDVPQSFAVTPEIAGYEMTDEEVLESIAKANRTATDSRLVIGEIALKLKDGDNWKKVNKIRETQDQYTSYEQFLKGQFTTMDTPDIYRAMQEYMIHSQLSPALTKGIRPSHLRELAILPSPEMREEVLRKVVNEAPQNEHGRQVTAQLIRETAVREFPDAVNLPPSKKIEQKSAVVDTTKTAVRPIGAFLKQLATLCSAAIREDTMGAMTNAIKSILRDVEKRPEYEAVTVKAKPEPKKTEVKKPVATKTNGKATPAKPKTTAPKATSKEAQAAEQRAAATEPAAV